MKLARWARVTPLLSAVMLTAATGLTLSVARATPTDSATTEPAPAATPAPTQEPAATSPGAQPPPADQPAAAPATPEAAAPASPPAPAAQTPSGEAAPATPAATPPETPAPTPPATDAAAPAAAPAPPAQADVAPAVTADPIVVAVREKLNDKSFASKAAEVDRAAAIAFYAARTDAPLWVKSSGGYTPAADAAVAEIRKADDWGLTAANFTLPQAAPDSAQTALAEAEATVTLAVLEYVREARGGRIDPKALSPALDQTPPLKDPKVVLDEVTKASAADAYLRDQHPKHEQFVRLREVLLKMRAPSTPPPPEDEALAVKLPAGKVIKPGMDHPDVSLLRRRLKVMAEAGNENVYDENLQEAVMAFQRANGVKANGYVGKATRAALNGDDDAGADSKPDTGRDIQRIVNNMERWRWMPADLGPFYIWNNIPEFKTRAIKDGKQVYDERIVVGLPQWPTPAFSAQMRTIVFHPEWGVPDGIKTKELQPQLRRSTGGGNFFEDLFGGPNGGSSSSAVLRRHDLKVSYNGRPVDPDTVNWGSVDIRRYQFTQPSGPKNVLGIVKFLFPNKHDVYMHDTTAKHLFKQNMRAYSHGCMRVNDPVRFAELLLQEDKGWSASDVDARFGGGINEVKIDKPIWVHTTYQTAVVDDSGKLTTFADVYGFEPRVAAALSGKQYRFEAPPQIAEVDPDAPPASTQKRKKQRVTQTDPLTEAITGLFAN